MCNVTLLHALMLWSWGRVLIANSDDTAPAIEESVRRFGAELGQSKLLRKSQNWSEELNPSVLFITNDLFDD